MAEFKISRLRYRWIGNWQQNYAYRRDDCIFYAGGAWTCIRAHQSSTFFADQNYKFNVTDTEVAPAWSRMTGGLEFKDNWTTSTVYTDGDVVSHGGNIYTCAIGHVSSATFDLDYDKWTLFFSGENWTSSWTSGYRYKLGDIAVYNGITYRCILEHTSSGSGINVGSNDGNNDSANETWEIVVENVAYRGSYTTSTLYRKNDIVKYGGSLLVCSEEHTSSSTVGNINNLNFLPLFYGFNYNNSWSNSSYYAIGDIVRVSSSLYIALSNNINSEPGNTIFFPNGNPDWSHLVNAVNFVGSFNSTVFYKKGDLVKRGGALWVALTDQTENDSTLAYLDDSNWEIVVPGNDFRGNWALEDANGDFTYYNSEDVVYHKGSAYRCLVPHLSTITSSPITGLGVFWAVLIENEPGGLDQIGDLLTFGKTILGDDSSRSPQRIPIGDKDHTLTVLNPEEGTFEWQSFGDLQRKFHVAPNGVDDDDPERGINYFKPYKTIRFAAEKADDGFVGYTTIKIRTGKYQEVLPIIVPERTAMLGEELRAVIVEARGPIPELENDAPKTKAALARLAIILDDLFTGVTISKSLGNTATQDTTYLATATEADLVQAMIADAIQYIDYKLEISNSKPVVTGNNTLTTNASSLAAANNISANRNFLKQEVLWFTKSDQNYVFDEELCLRDLDRFIDAFIYDLRYPGNYKSVLAGRYYGNAVVGSELEDMFYVRDATGIRNMTLTGLNGSLASPIPGELYRRPTGGNYVSLDPGWGPDDQRVWIKTRSCYVQNCTTFGYGAVGQKIDGSLHNGGNKSIVSNDFTQVISDGVGAWVLNGGRAELVSVFTYYAQIGMFAEDGGIIRATNGNSSYGTFGAVADGDDPEEIVRFGKINARDQQAQVAAAFCGEATDEVFALEFSNAGQYYTTVNYSFQGSGSGISVQQEEFRDNAIYECQVLSKGGSYIIRGFNAQFGDDTTITLGTNDDSDEAEILGTRIIIIAGDGTGQYGYVYAYNENTKQVQVYKESDNTPGWDHVVPGYPIKAALTGTARYRFEPRPIFSHPGFVATEYNLPTDNLWGALIYGETKESYNGIITDQGLALFNIVKTNRTYNVTLAFSGNGYSVGDILTIVGSQVNGNDFEHDIKITVTGVGSNGAITTFNFKGLGISGKFLLFSLNGDTIYTSREGETWTGALLPIVGEWRCVGAGNNGFVALKYNSNQAVYSEDGNNWTESQLPSTSNWVACTYGSGIFLAIASNQDAGAFSEDGGETWTFTELPAIGDSTQNEWVDITYGQGKFLAIANSGNALATGVYNSITSQISWSATVIEVQDSTLQDWVGISYGAGKFVALSSTGYTTYSFNGVTWYSTAHGMPGPVPGTEMTWKKIIYGHGVFLALCTSPTNTATTFCATSENGVQWTERTLDTNLEWNFAAFGSPDITLGDSTISNNTPLFVATGKNLTNAVNKIVTGARALGRAVVEGGQVTQIRLWNPGSGYADNESATCTLVDPNNNIDAVVRCRVNDGVIPQPTFFNRGIYWKTNTTVVTVIGDGFADIQPVGKFITVDGLSLIPGPGAQFYIGGKPAFWTAVKVDIDTSLNSDGTYKSTFQVSPLLTYNDEIQDDMEVLIKERYSQVRITGHDFLDVGTGNFIDANYPTLYIDYEFDRQPQNEVGQLNGGRVFYTSTDQDGNFRAGELFAVEQATGAVTLSADFFDLSGLTEIALGGIIVGGTATVVREFSTDVTMQANSNNIIPTQRAIAAFLNNKLNVGGEDLLTASFIAGVVKVGPAEISNTASFTNQINVVADFSGAGVHIQGSWLAQNMFYRSFRTR